MRPKPNNAHLTSTKKRKKKKIQQRYPLEVETYF